MRQLGWAERSKFIVNSIFPNLFRTLVSVSKCTLSENFASVNWRKSQNDFHKKLCLPPVRCQDINELMMDQCHWCSEPVTSIVKRIGLIENNIHQMMLSLAEIGPLYLSVSFERHTFLQKSYRLRRNAVFVFFFVNNSNVDFSFCCCLSVNVESILEKLCKIDWNKNGEYATQTTSHTAKTENLHCSSWMESCFV